MRTIWCVPSAAYGMVPYQMIKSPSKRKIIRSQSFQASDYAWRIKIIQSKLYNQNIQIIMSVIMPFQKLIERLKTTS